jgi:hypothetical protein
MHAVEASRLAIVGVTGVEAADARTGTRALAGFVARAALGLRGLRWTTKLRPQIVQFGTQSLQVFGDLLAPQLQLLILLPPALVVGFLIHLVGARLEIVVPARDPVARIGNDIVIVLDTQLVRSRH